MTAALVFHTAAADVALACTFDTGLCTFENSVDHPWKWRSGSTPSSPTGPSSDHTSGAGHYMFVEASSPNFPNVGPFELEASLGGAAAGVAIFWYNLYGQSMGSLAFETYSTSSGWVQLWSKLGNQGEAWQMATVVIDSTEASRVKFVAYSGWDYTGDAAIDDVNITRRTTPAPSVTAAPSATPVPTSTPSLTPTQGPTTLLASTASQLQSAVQSNGFTVSVGSDITLTNPIAISNVTSVRIRGNNFEVNGGGGTRCFTVTNAEVLISNLVVADGFSWGAGGGMFINGNSAVTLTSCVFLRNSAYQSSGGAIYANAYNAVVGKVISIALRNCTFSANTASFGAAIRFNFQVCFHAQQNFAFLQRSQRLVPLLGECCYGKLHNFRQ
jgi:predicted outer membrane repeat protein